MSAIYSIREVVRNLPRVRKWNLGLAPKNWSPNFITSQPRWKVAYNFWSDVWESPWHFSFRFFIRRLVCLMERFVSNNFNNCTFCLMRKQLIINNGSSFQVFANEYFWFFRTLAPHQTFRSIGRLIQKYLSLEEEGQTSQFSASFKPWFSPVVSVQWALGLMEKGWMLFSGWTGVEFPPVPTAYLYPIRVIRWASRCVFRKQEGSHWKPLESWERLFFKNGVNE